MSHMCMNTIGQEHMHHSTEMLHDPSLISDPTLSYDLAYVTTFGFMMLTSILAGDC